MDKNYVLDLYKSGWNIEDIADETGYEETKILEVIDEYEGFPESTFTICNFVPNWFVEDPIKLVHERFRNCYTFYPQNLVKNEEGVD